MQKKKILFLFYRTPFNCVGSNDRRQYLIFSTLSEKFDTKILAFGEVNQHSDKQQIIWLKNFKLKKIINFLLKLQSPRITHYYSKEFNESLVENLKTYQPDLIYVEHLLMMQYVLNIETSAKIIFFNDESNLFVDAKKLRNNLYERIRNFGLARMDLEACKRADFVFVITKEEGKFLESNGIQNIATIPYGIDTNHFSFNWQRPESKSILFLGDFSHPPNRVAVKLLCKRILPSLSDHNVNLKIVGRNIHRVEKYFSGKIDVYKDVEDVRPFYWNSSVFVAPVISGAGLRVKILEAALSGIPLIITSLANLGIDLISNEEAFICNSIEQIIQNLEEYFVAKKDDRFDQMRQSARNKIIKNFDERVVKNIIINSFEKISN